MRDFCMTIDGQPFETTETFEVKNPATGEVIATAPNATAQDLDRAVAAAQAAFPAWSAMEDGKRKAICEALTGAIAEQAEDIARTLTMEQGKPLNGIGSRFELGGAQAWAGYTAALDLPVKILQDDENGRIEQHRVPIGVVGSITPWNWPVMIAIWHIMPALRAGNTVVIKPSPFTPLSTMQLVETLNAHLPAGVLNVITSDDSLCNIGAAMSAHAGIGKVVFTGSCGTGEKVMQSAASTMKRLTLELGGNDAGIVLPDVDPAAIAEGLFWGAFGNNGQTCAALKRLYVHDDVYDDVCDALVDFARTVKMGNGLDEDTALGPVNNQMQFDVVSRLVTAGAAEGRVLLGGAPGEGLFYPVTLIGDLSHENPLVAQEQFGPALPIVRYTDLEEAISMANDSENGLGASVWSGDIDKARAIALRLEAGSVWVNKHGAIQPNVPFGGQKRSGLGVEFGEEGLFENTNIRIVSS